MSKRSEPLSPFAVEVEHRLALLLERHGLEKVAEHYHKQAFGNAYLDFCSPILCLRLINDRSQVFAEVRRPEEAEWRDIGRYLPQDRPPSHDLETVARRLEAGIEDLERLLG